MGPKQSLGERFAVFAALGRVSNLPTVWSNCLAAWLLGGAGNWQRFSLLGVGATLLYLGGMFLNDAFDVAFDRQYRPERPIPSGRISERAVWGLAASFLSAGWLVVLQLGERAAVLGSMLLASIVLYDAIHKGTGFAPALMAACRFVLYLTAAAAAQDRLSVEVVCRSLALAGYILGISCLARGESKPTAVGRWPIALLFAPVLMALVRTSGLAVSVWVVAACQITWISWCILVRSATARFRLSTGVAGLLAGIALVDWLAVAEHGPRTAMVFASLFLLALALQRLTPAT
jgi:4-hydroxybenzoate polyprenyltransferase